MNKTSVDDRPLSKAEVRVIMQIFERCGYSVRALDEWCFEFRSNAWPIATHVYATPYFLQLTSFSHAIPHRARGEEVTVRDRLLNKLNRSTNLVKVTCDDQKISQQLGGWRIRIQAKLIPGIVRSRYTIAAIRGFTALWFHEFAQVVLLKHRFERGVFGIDHEAQHGATCNSRPAGQLTGL
jgi:hypothetical protein